MQAESGLKLNDEGSILPDFRFPSGSLPGRNTYRVHDCVTAGRTNVCRAGRPAIDPVSYAYPAKQVSDYKTRRCIQAHRQKQEAGDQICAERLQGRQKGAHCQD